ncbi:hypothetical protein [Rhodococcoides fascians]|uniref:hypothetical protein n=1 Tax=Rhodococcoides fascians TaxID=1828 RepID=UPI00050C2B36|nr:hypothetical protein [Rhodococcus fascians]
MTWKITDPDDDARWLESDGGVEFSADPETTYRLRTDGYAFPLTPTGPFIEITDGSSLYAAGLHLFAGATVTGDPPPLPTVPSIPGRVY